MIDDNQSSLKGYPITVIVFWGDEVISYTIIFPMEDIIWVYANMIAHRAWWWIIDQVDQWLSVSVCVGLWLKK